MSAAVKCPGAGKVVPVKIHVRMTCPDCGRRLGAMTSPKMRDGV
jgi:predicted RNA-binding Zn-ribbon protein involved in translation (DUF1610 family)